ncbi:unnamed protein product [Bursaphelenchus xylophilus]|nr:unnamed protein product [Bursaphelenchus xylophilus]CAG9123907.1 unnamed protein product [Bursaphelenchus xylophilus]
MPSRTEGTQESRLVNTGPINKESGLRNRWDGAAAKPKIRPFLAARQEKRERESRPESTPIRENGARGAERVKEKPSFHSSLSAAFPSTFPFSPFLSFPVRLTLRLQALPD